MKKMYIVKYDTGHYSDCDITTVFVTSKKSNATKYVTKFNALLKKWHSYYKYVQDDDSHWIKDKYVDKYYRRWSSLRRTNYAYWEEVDVR